MSDKSLSKERQRLRSHSRDPSRDHSKVNNNDIAGILSKEDPLDKSLTLHDTSVENYLPQKKREAISQERMSYQYELMMIQQKLKQQKIEAQQKEKQEAEVKECTFQPCLPPNEYN